MSMFSRGYFWPRWYSAFSAVVSIGGGGALLLWGSLPAWMGVAMIVGGLCNVQAALRPRHPQAERRVDEHR